MRVLVVDDDPLAGEVTAAILIDAGHEVEIVEDGVEAAEKLAAESFALVVSDMNMPLFSGLDLFRELRDQGEEIAFILLTGDDPGPLLAEEPRLDACLLKDDAIEAKLVEVVDALSDDKTEAPGKQALGDKIQELRQHYLDRLPGTVANSRALCSRLENRREVADWPTIVTELHRVFHSIKGTAASFGLKEIGEQGSQGERLIAPLKSSQGAISATSARSAATDARLILDRIESLANVAKGGKVSPDWSELSLPPKNEPNLPPKVIFVCDDDELDCNRLAVQLSCFGYKVETFTTTDALEAAATENPPDAVLMDIIFPSGSNAGTEMIARLREVLPREVPVVFISARTDFDARLHSVQAGGQAYFTKPVRADELIEVVDALTSRQKPKPYRVLVVDDEPEVAEYHSLILRQAGMMTRILTKPDLVLDALTEFGPDLVLMDMYMPECTGRELAQVIRQIPDFISLPIVYLSVETDKKRQVSALKVGAEGFLTKPIHPEDLISMVAIRAERMRTLRALMIRDGLTGLFNHTFISQYLDTALAAAQRDHGKVCWAMLDVDHFKTVNDTFGHIAGDRVLVALARLLRQRLRHSDLIGRYGGEEFAVIMQNVDSAGAAVIMDQLRQDFARLQFRGGVHNFSCTFSAGIACFPEVESERLVESADRSLYSAKRAGRNCIRVASSRESV